MLSTTPYYTETYTILLEPIQNPSPSARKLNLNPQSRPASKSVLSAFLYGLGAGLVGATAMSITETVEQHVTGRAPSYAPGDTLLRFFRHLCSRSKSPTPDKGKSKAEEMTEEMESESIESENLALFPEGENKENQVIPTSHWATYFGHGALLGGFRGILSYYGIRGPATDLVFLGVRSCVDQGLSYWTDAGDFMYMPWSQQITDLFHQAVYAFVTGFFCDHWVS